MPDLVHQGQNLHYTDQGCGPTVVLLHSFLCSSEMWREQAQALSSNYRVVCLDLRGHGGSLPAAQAFDCYDLVQDVIALLDHLQIKKAVWGGLSLGGMVAMRGALFCPRRVSGLMLLDSHAGAERFRKKIKYRLMGLGAKWFGFGPMTKSIVPLMFGASTLKNQPELVSYWGEKLKTLNVKSILRGLSCLMKRDDVVNRLPDINTPALVVVGDQDIALPPQDSRQISEGISQSTLCVVPEAGHLSNLEQPEVVSELMLDFLNKRINRQD